MPSIEDSWVTMRWEVRVFSFLLAITEVNAFLALQYFTFGNGAIEGCPTLLQFRRLLAWQLIKNRWIVEEERVEAELRVGEVHQLLTAPKNAKSYRNWRWDCTATAPYQQYKCRKNCTKKVRTYCACTPGEWLCYNCFPDHVRRMELER